MDRNEAREKVLKMCREDLQKRLQAGETRISLPNGEKRAAKDLSDEELATLEPEAVSIVFELIAEMVEAENEQVVLLEDGKRILKRIDRLEDEDLPAALAYLEHEYGGTSEERETLVWFGKLMQQEGLRRGLNKEEREKATIGDLFLANEDE